VSVTFGVIRTSDISEKVCKQLRGPSDLLLLLRCSPRACVGLCTWNGIGLSGHGAERLRSAATMTVDADMDSVRFAPIGMRGGRLAVLLLLSL
jgi:hypothetical protein